MTYYFVTLKDRDGNDIYADEMPNLRMAQARAKEMLNDPEVQEDAYKVEVSTAKSRETPVIVWDKFK